MIIAAKLLTVCASNPANQVKQNQFAPRSAQHRSGDVRKIPIVVVVLIVRLMQKLLTEPPRPVDPIKRPQQITGRDD